MSLLRIKIASFLFIGLFLCLSCSKDEDPVPPKTGTVVDPDPEPIVSPSPDFGMTDVEANATIITQKMGAGFNLGNTFDLRANSTDPNSIKPIIDLYVEGGMTHMRIPVTWTDEFNGDHLTDALGNIKFSHPRFSQLKEVIDYALGKGIYVVINAHHEREFKETYSNSTKQNEQFTNLWTGIATYFKNYPQTLIFEILNEPEGAFGDFSGSLSPFDENAITLTRTINTLGFNTIRNSDPLNANRVVMISTNGQGNHSMIEEVYPTKNALPGNGEDDFLVIQLHTYDPWPFCGQNGANSAYPGKETVEAAVRRALDHAKTLEVPVNYGEFGVGRVSRQQDRNTAIVREYYRTIVQTVLGEGMSVTPWDDRGWFGLVSRNSAQEYEFNFDIVPSMLAAE